MSDTEARSRGGPLSPIRWGAWVASFAFGLWACAGQPARSPGSPPAVATPRAPIDGGEGGGFAGLGQAETGPPLVRSRFARVRPDGTAWPCVAAFRLTNGSPVAELTRLAESCDGQSKEVSRKTLDQSDRDAAQAMSFSAVTGACYRAYAVFGPEVRSASLGIRDSAGGTAAEASASRRVLVVPEDGPLCFERADEATVVVGVGSGRGPAAISIRVVTTQGSSPKVAPH